MKPTMFREIESADEFKALLQEHHLLREDDVTFEELDEGKLYVLDGDGFELDTELLEQMEIAGLLVRGSVEVEFLDVGGILPDYGVFAVTGSVRCKDMRYATESTGVVIGGDLQVDNVFYADCGNSVLQVNGDLSAKLLFNAQCSIDVRGAEKAEFDERVSGEQLASMGLAVGEDGDAGSAVSAHFRAYEQ